MQKDREASSASQSPRRMRRLRFYAAGASGSDETFSERKGMTPLPGDAMLRGQGSLGAGEAAANEEGAIEIPVRDGEGENATNQAATLASNRGAIAGGIGVQREAYRGQMKETDDSDVTQIVPIELRKTMHLPSIRLSTILRNRDRIGTKDVEREPGNRALTARQALWDLNTQDLPEEGMLESETWREATIPMMVLSGLARKDGQEKPVMQSDISGAASAAGMVGLGNILGNIFKFVSVFLVQYGFGPAVYGLYTLGTSMVNLISSLCNLGLDDAMVRYTAIYRSRQNVTSLRGLTIFCTALAGIMGIIGALLLLFFTPVFVSWNAAQPGSATHHSVFAETIPVLQLMAPLIPLSCMQIVWVGGLRGFKAFKWRVLTTNILQPVLQIVLLLVVLFFFLDSLNITGVIIALLLTTLVGAIFNLYFLFRETSRVTTAESGQYEVREWLTFSSLNFLTTIVDTVLDSTDTILLFAFAISTAAIGLYGEAIRYSMFISLPLLSINNSFAPTIAELHSQGEHERLKTLFQVLTKWTITLSLPIFLVLTLFAPFVMVLPGIRFLPGWPLLIAFAIGDLVNASTGAVGYMLLMTGYNKLSFLNSLVAVVVNVVLGIVLTPRLGAMGTAISTGVAICVLNIMRLLQVRILLKMLPYRWDTLKPVAAGVLSSALIGGVLYLFSNSHLQLSITLGHAVFSAQLLLIPVFLVLYIGLIGVFKISPEDEIVVRVLRKKLLRGKKYKK